MKTLPNFPLSEHIQGLVKHLRVYFPEVTENELVFYKAEDLVQTEKRWNVNKSKLMNRKEFEIFFQKLCLEGREWINLIGDSWHGNVFIISVEYSRRHGLPMTSILLSGPVTDGNGKPLSQIKFEIIG